MNRKRICTIVTQFTRHFLKRAGGFEFRISILESSSFVYLSVKYLKFVRSFLLGVSSVSVSLQFEVNHNTRSSYFLYTILDFSRYCSVKYFSLTCLFGQVFLEPLKEIQQMGHLQHVDVNKIFCNLEELCEVMQGKHSPVELCCLTQ